MSSPEPERGHDFEFVNLEAAATVTYLSAAFLAMILAEYLKGHRP